MFSPEMSRFGENTDERLLIRGETICLSESSKKSVSHFSLSVKTRHSSDAIRLTDRELSIM